MARPLRIEFPGALYHITARGDAQQAIFLDDEDRQQFLSVLARIVSRISSFEPTEYGGMNPFVEPTLSTAIVSRRSVVSWACSTSHSSLAILSLAFLAMLWSCGFCCYSDEIARSGVHSF